jgi:hypothetical protein
VTTTLSSSTRTKRHRHQRGPTECRIPTRTSVRGCAWLAGRSRPGRRRFAVAATPFRGRAVTRPTLGCCPGPTGVMGCWGRRHATSPVIATVVFVASLAGSGCASPSADQPAASRSSGRRRSSRPSRPLGRPLPRPQPRLSRPAPGAPSPRIWTGRVSGHPRLPRVCSLRSSCHHLWGHGAGNDAANTNGNLAASFAVPSGFAGSHYPGRKDTFQAKGRRSGKVASATFTVTG